MHSRLRYNVHTQRRHTEYKREGIGLIHNGVKPDMNSRLNFIKLLNLTGISSNLNSSGLYIFLRRPQKLAQSSLWF